MVFEDVVTLDLQLTSQKLWARQLNVENEGTQLWVLGLKTERGGTLVDTRGNGNTEIIGGFSYTTIRGQAIAGVYKLQFKSLDLFCRGLL